VKTWALKWQLYKAWNQVLHSATSKLLAHRSLAWEAQAVLK